MKRWEHRVTSVVGGPGLGKTTLLAQALAENRLAPRGEDIWIGIETHDADADRLANIVATALTRNPDEPDATELGRHLTPAPGAVANALWRRSPAHVCLVFDDVHRLPPGSAGAAWLDDLVTTLPTNGHIVLASRSEPPVALTRLSLHGAALHLDEDDLLFDDDELAGFATQRGLDPDHFANTGGWPAMAELTATIDRHIGAGDYLWDEILQPLGTERRHVLAVLTDLGGADDELASASVGTPVELTEALEGVPLVAQRADGWHVPHRLWGAAPELELDEADRARVRRRAVEHLVQRGRFHDAFTLAQDGNLPDAAADVLRAACVTTDQLVASQLGQWLSASSDAVRRSLAGRLADSLHIALTAPDRAVEPLHAAMTECREAGDIEAELTIVSQLSLLGWWRQDLASLAELFPRVVELEEGGHPKARGLAALGRAVAADLMGAHRAVDQHFAGIESVPLDPAWEGYVGWLWGIARINNGEPEAAYDIAERFAPKTDTANRYILEALRLSAWWAQGRVDDVLEALPTVMSMARRTGQKSNLHVGLSIASLAYSRTGDTTAATQCLDDAVAWAPPFSGDAEPVSIAMPKASLHLAEGEEERARAVLEETVAAHGLDKGFARHTWRNALCCTYVLLPKARTYWDGVSLRGHLQVARELAAAVVDVREQRSDSRLRALDLSDLGIVRTSLHLRFAAELAVGLAEAGRPEGRVLLDVLGPAGRDAVRELPRSQPRLAKAARSLLATVPAPPPRSTYLAVLGSLVLRRDGPHGEEITDPDLRRKRVQTLLAYLVGHRRTTRTAICAALWPDLDERSAANNLSVTLNHLLRLLEPQRATGEPAYLLRVDGQTVQLTTGDHLQIDLDDFDHHISTASQAEADGLPSLALEDYLSAIELYRDDLHLDLDDADWLTLDREHYRTRFVTTATRAGQLLLGRGDTNHAQTIAHRALTIDPWSEDAYTILVNSALARGDRTGAHRLFQRCLDALTDLGVTPSTTTRQLQHRLQSTGA